jgi:Flp pilus assembly pilin Flp
VKIVTKPLHSFLNDESGAITVDWVVLTATIVGLCLSLIVIFSDALFGASGTFETELQNAMTEATAMN